MKKHPALVQLGNNIRFYRKTLGLSQEELGFEIELDRTYISDVEHGKRNISALNLLKIAKRLKIEVGELFPDIRDVSI